MFSAALLPVAGLPFSPTHVVSGTQSLSKQVFALHSLSAPSCGMLAGSSAETLACFALIAWFGAVYAVKAAEHSSASLQIPMSIPYAVIPLAALVFIVHVLADMGATRRPQDPAG